MNCSLIRTLNACTEKGWYEECCLVLHTSEHGLFFNLGSKLTFSLDFNSTSESVNGGGILQQHCIF